MQTNRLKLIFFMVLVVAIIAQARKYILVVIKTPGVYPVWESREQQGKELLSSRHCSAPLWVHTGQGFSGLCKWMWSCS